MINSSSWNSKGMLLEKKEREQKINSKRWSPFSFIWQRSKNWLTFVVKIILVKWNVRIFFLFLNHFLFCVNIFSSEKDEGLKCKIIPHHLLNHFLAKNKQNGYRYKENQKSRLVFFLFSQMSTSSCFFNYSEWILFFLFSIQSTDSIQRWRW